MGPVSIGVEVQRNTDGDTPSRHLSVTSSVHKVLSEYYWPGIYRDVKRFVQACNVFKSSLHDGKTGEVSAIIESATGMKNSEQQHQVSKTVQVNETIDNTT